jgi:hypothetical protein
MKRAQYNFQDILDLNKGNWDHAYHMLQVRLQDQRLIKKILPGDVVIYLPHPDLIDPELIYGNFFFDSSDPYNAKFPSIK